MMKPLIFAILVVIALNCVNAPAVEWQPAPGLKQIPIWPAAAPDPQPVTEPEEVKSVTDHLVAGKPWTQVGMVTKPTITVFSPKENNTGAAVLVFPGGGYWILAIDLEGTEVCEWLASKGITGILLKYRVPGEKRNPRSGCYPNSPVALEDAQRAMGFVRHHAAEWNIDPHKIGVMGFSAGGHLSAAISTHFEKRLYPAVDEADKESCRPDFAVPIYPGHMLEKTKKEFDLNPAVPVTSKTPPTLLVQAEDDPVDPIENSLVYYIALKKAGVPVEMHIYAQGGHAFGLRRTEFPITEWPQLMEKWLKTIGMVSK